MTKPAYVGSNASHVRAHNLQAILLGLLHGESVSRTHLAEQSGLSSTTITNLTGELLDQGIIIEEAPEPAPSGGARRPVGRPRRMLRLVPGARCVVGVHVGIGLFRVAVADLQAAIQANQITTFDLKLPASAVLDRICDSVEMTIDAAGVDRERLLGVGVGASGLVDSALGTNRLAPRLGWRDVPVRQYMEPRLGLPVCVDNNVRAMALGEAMFGAGQDVDVLAFIYGRVGVGAGLVVNGQVFRGSGAGAGEIGHTIVLPPPPNGEVADNPGETLETLVSEIGLVTEARALAVRHPYSLLGRALAQIGESSPVEAIFAAARQGDQGARALVEKRAYYLGIALANLVNVLNPELILLGGVFAQGHDLFLPVAELTMRQKSFGGLGETVRLQTSSFGWRAGVVGAAAVALTQFYYRQASPA